MIDDILHDLANDVDVDLSDSTVAIAHESFVAGVDGTYDLQGGDAVDGLAAGISLRQRVDGVADAWSDDELQRANAELYKLGTRLVASSVGGWVEEAITGLLGLVAPTAPDPDLEVIEGGQD